MRCGDYLAAFAARGFESQVVTRVMRDDYDYDLGRRALLSRFRRYSDDDLRCARVVILSRKIGAGAGPRG